MPIVGLGTWKAAPGDVYQAVKTAIEIGYRHIDCAFIYGNEAEVGDAIASCIQEGVVTREELWITSKLWNAYHKKEDVAAGMATTLKDLKLDYLDLYLIHWPVALQSRMGLPSEGSDFLSLEDVPLIETWSEMIELRKEGKTKHIGVSNFSPSKMDNITSMSGIKPEMNQVERHPYFPQRELITYCQSNGIHFTCYSPLGSPDRPARIKGENEPTLLENPVIKEIAEAGGHSPAQVLIAWSLQSGLSVIPKSTNPDRLQQNLDTWNITLSDEHMAKVDALDMDYRYLNGSIWTLEGSPYTLENLWA